MKTSCMAAPFRAKRKSKKKKKGTLSRILSITPRQRKILFCPSPFLFPFFLLPGAADAEMGEGEKRKKKGEGR